MNLVVEQTVDSEPADSRLHHRDVPQANALPALPSFLAFVAAEGLVLAAGLRQGFGLPQFITSNAISTVAMRDRIAATSYLQKD